MLKNQNQNQFDAQSNPGIVLLTRSTVVILLKATKGKSQNRISLKQQRILKNDKSEIS